MLVTFLFVAIIARLVYIEVFSSEKLQALALDQWMRDVPLTAERGEIYDKNGKLLAGSRTVYTVYVRPMAVKDKKATAKALSEVLSLDFDWTLKRVSSRMSEMTIARRVEKEKMLEILSTGATGIYYSQNIERVYPYGDFMTQILGFTSTDSNGQTGVEMQYNAYLKGVDGYVLTETDLVGRELSRNVTKYIAGTKGFDAHLTVDYYIQSFAESAVDNAMAKHLAKGASCIVMDVKTGEIYAMAQRPSFDLNNVPRDNVVELFTNSKSSLVSNVIEPGSTFKILTAAIGLDSGAINEKYTSYCTGYHIVDGQRIKCWKTIGHGSQTFEEGVRNSCNVLFMNTALKIGTPTFYEYMRNFGLFSKTGIDIAGESAGLSITEADVKSVDLARIGFGHAVAVTPIELLRSSAGVVNNGVMVTPYILDRLVDSTGEIIYKNYPNLSQPVISSSSSEIMRRVLEEVVANGSGRNAGVAGYRIGGKTGTAQKYEDGHIARGKYVSTFLGFAPADDPKYIALMVVDEPQGMYYGSMVAAPYVGEIFEKIFHYTGLKPADYTEKEQFDMPDLVGLSGNSAAAAIRKLGMHYETMGEGGEVTNQIPAAGSKVTTDTIILLTLG